jgi:hypothetical protein
MENFASECVTGSALNATSHRDKAPFPPALRGTREILPTAYQLEMGVLPLSVLEGHAATHHGASVLAHAGQVILCRMLR